MRGSPAGSSATVTAQPEPWARAAKASLIAALVCIAFVVGTARSVSPSGSFAYGCDAFAYQRQAELIRSRGLFRGLDTRLRTADAQALIAVAKQAGIPIAAWERILGPHCHHVDAHSGQIIAQYPPGTPLVLAIFKPGTAGYGAYLVLALGACLSALLFLTLGTPSLLQLVVAAASFTVGGLYFSLPMSWASYSVGITAGFTLLLTSLLLVRAHARLTTTMLYVVFGALAGLSLAVRVPNVFVIIGLAIAFAGRFEVYRLSIIRQRRWALMAGGAAFLIAGPALIAAGNWRNTGSILHTTYGAADASGIVWSHSLIVGHLRFYFLSCDSSVLVDLSLAVVALSIVASLTEQAGRLFRWATAAAAVTTGTSVLFFLMHEVTAPYYLVPSAVFSTAVLAMTAPYKGATVRLAYRPVAAYAGIGLLLVAAALRIPVSDERPPFSFSVPQEIVLPGAIVWSDFTSGTLLYYNGKVASKIVFGSPCERLRLTASAKRAGAAQYLIDDSPGMHDAIAVFMGSMKLKRIGYYAVFAPLEVWKIEDSPVDWPACT